MKLWKPKNGKKYYCVSVTDIAYLYYESHDDVSPYFIGYDENTKPLLCGDSVQIIQRTWNASKEDYERLLSLNVFATYEEAEKSCRNGRKLLRKTEDFLNKFRRSVI